MKVDVTNICHCWMCKKLLDCSPNTNYHTVDTVTVEQSCRTAYFPMGQDTVAEGRERINIYLHNQQLLHIGNQGASFLFISQMRKIFVKIYIAI